MRLVPALASVATAALLAACGSASPPATEPRTQTAPQVRAASSNPKLDTCVAMMERQRTCTDLYIPALVDLRVANDTPKGIAGENRDALLAQAFKEWAADSTDAAIHDTCMGVVDMFPGDELEPERQAVETCLAADGCQPFVDCIIPVTAQWWKKAAAARAGH
jgi:hypothetical protein